MDSRDPAIIRVGCSNSSDSDPALFLSSPTTMAYNREWDQGKDYTQGYGSYQYPQGYEEDYNVGEKRRKFNNGVRVRAHSFCACLT